MGVFGPRRGGPYDVVDLGTLGGELSRAQAINAGGKITGYAAAPSGSTHAFLWDAGAMVDLGVLRSWSSGAAINASGHVVGVADSPSQPRAVLWRYGELLDLGALPGHDASDAVDINDDGWIIGSSVHVTWPEEPAHAVLWVDGEIRDLGPNIRLYALNSHGVAAGCRKSASRCEVAIVWEDGVVTDLDAPAPAATVALDINDAGMVLSLRDGKPILWHEGTFTELSFLGGSQLWVSGMNNAGHVVGSARREDGVTTALLWRDGEWLDLGKLARKELGADSVPESLALAINDGGQVVGQLHIGSPRALLWNPR